MTFSENWSIVNDLPLFWDAELLKRGIHAGRMHEGLPSRFGLIPRHGAPEDIRWFEAAPTYILHFLNAYEDGDEVVMDAYFQDNPQPAPLPDENGYGHMMAYVDEHSFLPRLHRWRFNLANGTTREERLDDRVLEFGTINQKVAGQRHRYIYSTTTKPGWFLFNGFVKRDLQTGASTELMLAEGRFASEAPFAPRIGGVDEDDGYLVSFITDENTQSSECILVDAKDIAAGPVCRIALPHKISSGTHSHWADRKSLRKAGQ
jgi:carotenoid cleavage dioxygenase-like enzyme